MVLVCMLYYLDENAKAESWSNTTLKALRYNSKPQLMQHLISELFKRATSKIKVPGVKIVPIPMFEAMDGKNTDDYDNRVEPSI